MGKTITKLSCVLTMLFLLLLTGCDPYFGSFSRGHNKDEDFDLYQMAVYTVPGGEQRSDTCSVRTLDEDTQGRVLFTCSVDADQPIFAYLICQNRGETELLYYEDCCVIASAFSSDFTDEELTAFKRENDWDKELNTEKCLRLPVKPKNNKAWNRGYDFEDYDTECMIENREVLSTCEKELFSDCGKQGFYAYYSYGGSDKNGKRLYYIQAMMITGEERTVRILGNAAAILPRDELFDPELVILLDDFYHCGNRIRELKDRAGWQM